MAYSTIPKGSLHMNTKLYTGDSASSRTIAGIGFEPSLTWNKPRTTANDHQWVDAVRGGGKVISSNLADAEYTAGNTILSFGSDGFTCGDGASVNANGVTYASWNWVAGGSASSNSNGSITSSVSVNTDAGFSIVSWTGDGNNGATIAHGLGVTPAIVITKRRNTTGDFQIGGSLIDTVRGGANSLLLLNTTAAMDSNSEVYQTFSSTTFQVGVNASINASGGTLISYCFRDVQGYSKFGSYTGNGNADGPFTYLGFKPAWVLIKQTNSGNIWELFDNKRSPFNLVDDYLSPDASDAETTGSSQSLDFLSNGFKPRANASGLNGSGSSYIYMCFAENPFTTSTGVPATAR